MSFILNTKTVPFWIILMSCQSYYPHPRFTTKTISRCTAINWEYVYRIRRQGLYGRNCTTYQLGHWGSQRAWPYFCEFHRNTPRLLANIGVAHLFLIRNLRFQSDNLAQLLSSALWNIWDRWNFFQVNRTLNPKCPQKYNCSNISFKTNRKFLIQYGMEESKEQKSVSNYFRIV